MSLSDTIRAASERAAEEHQKVIRERLIQHAGDTYGYAAAYDNAVIIAGYAAFFALWAGVSADIERFARLVTVAMMGISLMSYIAWQLAQMLTRQKFEHERVSAFEFAAEPAKFNAKWIEVEQARAVAELKVIKFWPYFFLPSVALGFLAGIILSYNSLAAAFGWPQLTGRF